LIRPIWEVEPVAQSARKQARDHHVTCSDYQLSGAAPATADEARQLAGVHDTLLHRSRPTATAVRFLPGGDHPRRVSSGGAS
jgi:hypothetical protein